MRRSAATTFYVEFAFTLNLMRRKKKLTTKTQAFRSKPKKDTTETLHKTNPERKQNKKTHKPELTRLLAFALILHTNRSEKLN